MHARIPQRGTGKYSRTEVMKKIFFVLIAVLLICDSAIAQEPYRGGIVYGPKAAFNISAPEGWILDNQAGVEQGLPCVLYPKGES